MEPLAKKGDRENCFLNLDRPLVVDVSVIQ